MPVSIRIVMLFLLVAGCGKKQEVAPPVSPPANNAFANPILNRGPDPWVIRKDSFYYYTHTSGDRLQIWKTKTITTLRNVSPVTIWIKPASGANSQDIWAPELHYLNNKWYMYYTAGSGDRDMSQRIFLLENTSADPTTGTWTDKGRIYDPVNDYWAIDPHVFQFGGKMYLTWSGHATALDFTQRLYIALLVDPATLSGSRVEIASPLYNWEKAGAPPAVNEGPEVILNPAGKPVLVYSASGCWTDGYALGMLVLKDGGDPLQSTDWTKSPVPVFTTNGSGNAYGPGHCSFFKSADGTQDWLIYHANSLPNQGCGDTRNPRIQPFTWSSNGTPNFGEPVKTGQFIKKPSGE